MILKVCERNCGQGFYTKHRLDHTAKSAERTGSSEEKLEKHKDYKGNTKRCTFIMPSREQQPIGIEH